MADESTKPAAAAVDETPISPVRPNNPGRRNSLEQHLSNRPQRDELVQSASSLFPFPAGGGLLTRRPVCYREHLARIHRCAGAPGTAEGGMLLPTCLPGCLATHRPGPAPAPPPAR